MNTTIQTNIAQRINESFSRAEALAAQSRATGDEAVTEARNCGRLLIEAAQGEGKEHFTQWIADNCTIGRATAYKWIALSKVHCDRLLGCTGLTDAYRKAGILPEPELSSSTSAIVPFVTQLGQKVRLLRELIEPNLKDAKPNDVEQYKAVLKPLHELYERL